MARIPRTTGVLSGIAVVLLGAWAGFIPFVGPYFDFGFTPDQTWHYSSNRLWLSILPAAIAVVGGLMMIFASRRPSGALGAWLAIAAGAWLIVGPSVSLLWTKSVIGTPLGGIHHRAAEWVASFYGVGAAIVGFAAFAAGRFWSRPHLAERAEPGRDEDRPAAPAATQRQRGSEPQAAARESPRAGAAAQSAAGRRSAEEPASTGKRSTAAEPEPAEESATADPRTHGRDEPDGRQPAEQSPDHPVRVRRRQGGLVGRLLGRRSG
jgi:hypothetical protein